MKKFLLLSGLTLAMFVAVGFAQVTSADPSSNAANDNFPGSHVNVSIMNNGKVDISGAKIVSISNSSTTLSVVTNWGTASQTYTVDVSNASITRRYGYQASFSELSVGDYVSVTGSIDKTLAGLVIRATTLQNHSIQKYTETKEGTVTAKNASALTVVLRPQGSFEVTVQTTSTTTIQKQGVTASFADINAGSYIVVNGTYNNATKVMTAASIRIVNNPAYQVSRNYQGTLKSITVGSGYRQPAVMVVTIDGVDYTVHIAGGAAVYAKNFTTTSLSNYLPGHTVRFYGQLRAYDVNVADATVVRDLNI